MSHNNQKLCKRGHPLDEDGDVYRRADGRRDCRVCERIRHRIRKGHEAPGDYWNPEIIRKEFRDAFNKNILPHLKAPSKEERRNFRPPNKGSTADVFSMDSGDSGPYQDYAYDWTDRTIECRLSRQKYPNKRAAILRCREIHGKVFDGIFSTARFWVIYSERRTTPRYERTNLEILLHRVKRPPGKED